MNKEKTEKGYSTKYALTQGVQAVTVTINDDPLRQKYVYVKGNNLHVQLIRGLTFFNELPEALANARKQAAKRVGSLERQLVEMRKLAKEPRVS